MFIGKEFSFFIGTDGETIADYPTARDYKQRFEGNNGPNTGGMGAYSPNELVDESLRAKIMKRIAEPLIEGLRTKFGITYKGILYIGGMAVPEDGEINPYVLEFNVRLGDPEAQVILPRIDNLVEVLRRIKDGTLKDYKPTVSDTHYAAVVLVSGKTEGYEGYPGDGKKGQPITGIENVGNGAYFVHAGTKYNDARDGFVIDGGRVGATVAGAKTWVEAGEIAHRESEKILFDGKDKRNDVARPARKVY